MLRIQELRKSYGQQEVLCGVDLSVDAGEIAALIGINGAGKSTLASIVAGLRKPDAGTVMIGGADILKNPQAARQRLGLAAQEIGLYPTMTGRMNLNFFGRLAGMESQTRRRRIDQLAQSLDLAPLLDKPTQSLSGGQRRRLHAAIAMLHRPGVLWLDEPTAGADIQSRQQLLSEVRRFADEGGAVVYATHYFPEVEMLGASIAILHRGKILARGSSESITSAHALPSIMLEFAGDLPEHLRSFASAGACGTESRVVIPVRHPASDLAQVVCNLGEGADRLLSVELRRPGLESAFLRLTDADTALDEEETADVLPS